jgi:hypothetical protein
MSNKLKKKKRTIHTDEKQDSIFKEAWGNMNNDMAKIMPAFITSRLGKKGGKLWVMIVVTLLELVVLGVVGKLVYDWITK